MLKLLRRIVREVPADVRDVVNTSVLLEVSEFDVFRIAYARWYGQSAHDKLIERHFVHYMFGKPAPFWVRHFTRQVERRWSEGCFDPTEFGISPPQASAADSLVWEHRSQVMVVAVLLISVAATLIQAV